MDEYPVQRQSKRYPVRLRVAFVAGRLEGEGVARNLSSGGVFVETPHGPPPGQNINLFVLGKKGDPPLPLVGEVCRREESGFAVSGLNDEESVAALIERIILGH